MMAETGMTDFNQACNWLIQFEGSHLSLKARSMMDVIDAELGLPVWGFASGPANIDDAVGRYVQLIERSSEPNEYPEGMVRLARYYYNKGGSSVEVLDILNRAYAVYRKLPKSDFLLAVVSWLLGCVAVQMFDTQLAHSHWKEAITGFENVVTNAQSGGEYPKEYSDFCEEKLRGMWQEVIRLPEEVFCWLLDGQQLQWVGKYGGGDHMNCPTRLLKDILLQRQDNNDFRGVYADLEKFHKISKGSVYSLDSKKIWGEADALVVTGMLLFWMGNVIDARYKFKTAADMYLPDSHPDAVAHWLLGLMYLYPPNDKRKGVAYCQRAIHGFKRVKFLANSRHDQPARDWYREKISLLENTLALIESGLFS
jgi:hypothetical protein